MPPIHWQWSGLTLEGSGDASRIDHLVREFGRGETAALDRPADLNVRFGATSGRVDHHKATWWKMSFSAADEDTVSLSLELHGLFADGMVQSVVIEQALAMVAPRHGFALVPAAAMRSPDGRTMVILGASGAGKTTLAMSALVAGWVVLADDHLVVDRSGRCFGLPRRMRVYPSTIGLVPEAAGRLLPCERRGLTVRRIARQLTLGRVGLPVLVPPARFGHVLPTVWTPPDWIVSLRRSKGASSVRLTGASNQEVVEMTLGHIAADRARLADVLGEGWRTRLDTIHAAEAGIIEAGWDGVPAGRADVPASWTPLRTLDWLASATA